VLVLKLVDLAIACDIRNPVLLDMIPRERRALLLMPLGKKKVKGHSTLGTGFGYWPVQAIEHSDPIIAKGSSRGGVVTGDW
jgi:hypothetical protein